MGDEVVSAPADLWESKPASAEYWYKKKGWRKKITLFIHTNSNSKNNSVLKIIFLEVEAMAKTSLTYLYVKKKCDKFYSNFYSVAIEDAKPNLVTRRASGDKVSMSTVILPKLILTLTL